MLLAQNLPRPVGLAANGNANAREGHSPDAASHRAQRRGTAVDLSYWPKSVCHL
jgi:hypothetical protein